MTTEAGWSNPVKARLGRGEAVLGVTITTPSLDLAARAAALGFDFLWIEMEHSPITLETLRHIVLATRGLPALPFARVPVNELWTAKRALDAGVHGVIFPFTSRPELAQQAALACRYPPRGLRGSGAGLATASWPDPDRYCESADENVMVVAIIEEAAALAHVDAIASTPGIDVLFIGTSDLSFSMGHRGRQDRPDVQAAVETILQAALRHGKVAGRPVRTPDQVRAAMAQGFRLFQLSSDLQIFGLGARELLEPLGRYAGRDGQAQY
jgi:2-keto-3-deoxy-L-rhamnonate aldolase RhmA